MLNPPEGPHASEVIAMLQEEKQRLITDIQSATERLVLLQSINDKAVNKTLKLKKVFCTCERLLLPIYIIILIVCNADYRRLEKAVSRH